MTEWPILGHIFLAGSIHPVDRDNAEIEVFRLMIRILEAGNVVVVFPEGTRSADGSLQAAKDGVAMLALKTGAAILPVGVVDTDRFWPKGKPPRIGGQVELRVGRPFRLADVLPPDLDRRAAKSGGHGGLIMGRIAELLPARQRGVYGRVAGSRNRGFVTAGAIISRKWVPSRRFGSPGAPDSATASARRSTRPRSPPPADGSPIPSARWSTTKA